MILATIRRIGLATLALAAASVLAACADDTEDSAALRSPAERTAGAAEAHGDTLAGPADDAVGPSDGDAAEDDKALLQPRCNVPLFSLGWDSCVLQTQVGSPPGWLINHSGTVDECWYHCYHSPPMLPTTEYDVYKHGLLDPQSGFTWMRCGTGQTYQAGRAGFDCAVVPVPIPDPVE